jgi:hypothetical protein
MSGSQQGRIAPQFAPQSGRALMPSIVAGWLYHDVPQGFVSGLPRISVAQGRIPVA